jgi:hypothetical protein
MEQNSDTNSEQRIFWLDAKISRNTAYQGDAFIGIRIIKQPYTAEYIENRLSCVVGILSVKVVERQRETVVFIDIDPQANIYSMMLKITYYLPLLFWTEEPNESTKNAQ